MKYALTHRIVFLCLFLSSFILPVNAQLSDTGKVITILSPVGAANISLPDTVEVLFGQQPSRTLLQSISRINGSQLQSTPASSFLQALPAGWPV